MMSRFSAVVPFLTVLALGAGGLFADVPRKPPLSRYAPLWTESPFTTKPPEEVPVEGPNPLAQWLLGGISKVGDGYLVILFNSQDAADTRIVEPGDDGEFQVLDIRQDPHDYLQTQVQLGHRGQTGWVRYDSAQLELQPPPQLELPAPEEAAPAQGGNGGNENRRRPRVRQRAAPAPQ